jgi:hypothetical protein
MSSKTVACEFHRDGAADAGRRPGLERPRGVDIQVEVLIDHRGLPYFAVDCSDRSV